MYRNRAGHLQLEHLHHVNPHILRPPVKPPLPRLRPMASISSMKMIEGASTDGPWWSGRTLALPATTLLGWRVRDVGIRHCLTLHKNTHAVCGTKNCTSGRIISWRYWSRVGFPSSFMTRSLSIQCSGNKEFGIVGELAKRSWKQLSTMTIYIYIHKNHVKIILKMSTQDCRVGFKMRLLCPIYYYTLLYL